MQFKEIYDKKLFSEILEKLRMEHGDKIYDDKRISSEFQSLVNKELILCCLFDNNQLVGNIIYHKPNPEFKCCSVLNVFVEENFRGKGYGKIMMKGLEEHAKNLGLNKIILGSRRGREGFYYSYGFQGEALLQANKCDANKEDLKEIIKSNNIKNANYVFRNSELHQFYFDAKLIEDKTYDNIEKENKNIDLIVVFSKEL